MLTQLSRVGIYLIYDIWEGTEYLEKSRKKEKIYERGDLFSNPDLYNWCFWIWKVVLGINL